MVTEMTAGKPQVGDQYHCEICGMEVEVIMPCQSQHTGPEFRCCGAEMAHGGTLIRSPEVERGETGPLRQDRLQLGMGGRATESCALDQKRQTAGREIAPLVLGPTRDGLRRHKGRY